MPALKPRFLPGVFVVLVVVVAVIVWLRTSDAGHAEADVAEFTVTRRTFSSTVTAIGAVKPQIGAEVRVGSRLSGRVGTLRANIGDVVQAGAIIAELETDELDALIAQRRAGMKMAEARLNAFTTLGPEEEAQAAANVASAEASARLASEEQVRLQKLFDGALTSRAEADAARDRRAVAEAQVEASRRALALIRATSAEGRIEAAADVERARAALQSAIVDRSFTVLRSPIAGVVASVATQEGETIAAGLSAPTFVTIVDLERLQVDAYVDEVDIGKVQVGQTAVFTVDAYPSRDFSGRVAAIYPTATIQDNVVKYVAALEINGEYRGLLRPEMTAHVRIELESREVLAVPSRAIRQEAGRSVVFVAESGRAVARPIRIGWRDGPWAEVLEGLAAGDRILVDGPAVEGGR